jgi:glycosylphosphatidylinositol transamidase
MFLSALATLNFSLAFLVGILSTPLTFIRPTSSKLLSLVQLLVLVAVNPLMVILGASTYWAGGDVGAVQTVLIKAAEGWHIWGLCTQVVVWLVWLPAWFAGGVVVASSLFAPVGVSKARPMTKKEERR